MRKSVNSRIILLFAVLTLGVLEIGAKSFITPDKKVRFAPSFLPANINRAIDMNGVPGYVDPTDNPETCFDYMGSVDFTSGWRFKADQSDGQQYGFSIPLVGDLDGDVYPEIVSIGTSRQELHGYFAYLDIYNGQDGMRLAHLRLDLKTSGYVGAAYSSNYHGSPCIMAMADVDKDGNVEIIMAFPGSTVNSFPFANKVVSYRINKLSAPASGNYYSLSKVWESAERYNSEVNPAPTAYNAWHRAIPQIVDIDGNGVPEVVVYNKIYNAVTGDLLVKLEDLGTTAYVGSVTWSPEVRGDKGIGFAYTYDLDLDGKYDVAAGGKVYYDIDPATGTYELQELTSLPDGRTGVADINGDGIPDVVVADRLNDNQIKLTVWNPGFLSLDPSGNVVKNTTPQTPSIIAQTTIGWNDNATDQGTLSYVYIGDIDGLEQEYNGKKYRLPEIAILSGHMNYSTVTQHPNVTGKGIPTTGWSNGSSSYTGNQGVLGAFTFDLSDNSLKLSFVLGHNDRSINTGFTMFDFDNDGIEEICYRDEFTLRIIKASSPFVTDRMTIDSNPGIIIFKENCNSFTGFEYPVIADIDNDASAEMIVIGRSSGGTDNAWGWVYAVGNGNGDKFAPTRPVWNQFLYDPFKINDDLTIPSGPAKNRLTYVYQHEVKAKNGNVIKNVENYQPYNNTLGQVPYYMTLPNGTGKNESFEPIVYLTEGLIVPGTASNIADRPKITLSGGSSYIEVTISNKNTARTDISPQTPISVYENIVSRGTFVGKYHLNELEKADGSGKVLNAIQAGKSVRVKIPVPDPYTIYYVRLGDNSRVEGSDWKWHYGTNNGGKPGSVGDIHSNPPVDTRDGYGIDIASRAYRDCDWRDNIVKVSLVILNPDAIAIQAYKSVTIDVLDNDEYPANFPANFANFKMTQSNIRGKGPVAGTLTFSGKKIIYTHNDTIPPNNIDTFSYAFMYKPEGATNEVQFSGNVYIYIMQPETGGFGACYGDTYRIKLKENPVGIRFIWWDEQGALQTTNDSLTVNFGTITADKTYTVKPLLDFYNGDPLNFIPGKLTIGALGSGQSTAVMKWTGNENTNWHNPHNWVEIKNNKEVATTFVPTACVDVIISSGAKHYPMLKTPAVCANITMKDHAMIAGIHHLTYDNAQVEMKLKPTERDRFIMWSAPLKSMYSGDYHFKEDVVPKWGDIYMNLFQHANPDGTSASGTANAFTATFGNLGEPLTLGKAFNLKVVNTSANKEKTFVFPQSSTTYTDADGHTYNNLTRTNSAKFIADKEQGNTFNLTVVNDVDENSLVQIVNPYMAYLDINKFLLGNSDKLSTSFYATWTGELSESFTQIGIVGDKDNRYKIETIPSGTFPDGLIPPLQSFFVQKNATAKLGTVKMSSDWATTVGTSPYVLRKDTKETNVLRMKVIQDNRDAYAILHYNKSASPTYKNEEDMNKLFYSEVPLEVYSITVDKKMLAINSSDDFAQNIPIGVRTDKAGSATLEFSGMETFGHKVYLIDHTLNKEIDLQKNPKYTFTVTKKSANDKIIELDDRFSLRTTYTGIGVGNEEISFNDLSVSSRDGYIYVQASLRLSSLQIYNMTGAMVYSSNAQSDQFRIRVDRQQTYIVKAKASGEYIIQKVFVK